MITPAWFIRISIDVVRFYELLVFARILASWFPGVMLQPWMRGIRQLTDPYLDVFRRVIPPLGMIDISPIAAFIVLEMLIQILQRLTLSL